MKNPKLECERCFEEEGSFACIRPSHSSKPKKIGRLARLVKETVEEVVESSENTFLTREFAQEAGLSRSAASDRLKKLQDQGKLERVRLIGTRNGAPYRGVQGWRFVDPVREQSVKKSGTGSGSTRSSRSKAVVERT